MRITDIHSHTYYSNCGRDEPEVIIEAALDGGIELFGICDHNYGIGVRKTEYLKHMTRLKELYFGQIRLLCGIEIATIPHLYDIKPGEIKEYDYCIIEHIDHPDSVVKGDIVSFAKQFGIPAGIAHTDLFGYCEKAGRDPLNFFKELADADIFWEMNVNYDSIHGYREHGYVIEFMKNPLQQEIVKKSGVAISVGFDGHKTEDYLPGRVKKACRALTKMGVKTAEEIILK